MTRRGKNMSIIRSVKQIPRRIGKSLARMLDPPEDSTITVDLIRRAYKVRVKNKALIKALTYASIVKLQYENREAMGILIGKKEGNTVVIEDVHVDSFIAEYSHTKTEAPSIAKIMKQSMDIKKKFPEKQIIGWVHSHPSFSIQPSTWDLETNAIWEKYMAKDNIRPIMMIVNDKEFWIGTTINGRKVPLDSLLLPDSSSKIDLNLSSFTVLIPKKEVTSIYPGIMGPDGAPIYIDLWGPEARKEMVEEVINLITFGLYYKIRGKKDDRLQQANKGGLEPAKNK
jgi:proteasome lid subunit RPN8/RPN11